MRAMPPDWFWDWIREHSRAFMLPAQWGDTAADWWGALDSLGATRERLAAATQRVMLDPPEHWGGHMPRVRAALGAVLDAEAGERRKAAATGESPSACPECGGGGGVLVPLPADVGCDPSGEIRWRWHRHNAVGEPVYRTGEVACRCSADRRPRQMGLARYESGGGHLPGGRLWVGFPQWREAMRLAEKEQEKRAAAVASARDYGRMRDNIAAAMRLPRAV